MSPDPPEGAGEPAEAGGASSSEGPTGSGRGRLGLGLALLSLAAAVVANLLGGGAGEGVEHLGPASLLPPVTALALAFVTREVISSLLVGVAVGGIVAGRWNLVDAYLIPSVGTESFALILVVYLWALGGLVGIWGRTGGARVFAGWAGRRLIRSPRTAKVFTWALGLVFHQGGTISAILTGTTVRAVTEEEGVSHEETSFLVDTTASPVASLIPLNVWPIYVAGLTAGTIPLLADQQAAVSFYVRAVPFNFYAVLVLGLALLFALGWWPWPGRRMRGARRRVRETGALNAPGARPLATGELESVSVPEGYRPGPEDFLLPLGALLGTAATGVVPAALAGDPSRVDVPIAEAFGLAVLAAGVLALLKGMALRELADGFLEGVKGVTIGAVLLALAVTLGEVTRDVGTAAFVVELVAEAVSPALLPAILFVVGGGVAFATGMSWGTYPVTFPVALPLAYAVSPDPLYVALCFSAVLGGGVFGDHTSPLSDTTILSGLATGSDLMDHTLSQLPMALTAAGMATVAFVAAGVALG